MEKFQNTINILRRFLNDKNLPGKKVQYQMTPPGRSHDYPQDNNYIDSAVAVFLYQKNEEIYFPLIKRTGNNHNDKHRGQISLPGGAFDVDDKSLFHCAIRELEEEVGIDKTDVNYIGTLTDLYIPVSNFKVQPYVVYSNHFFGFIPQPTEVDYVIEVKLNDLLDDSNSVLHKIELDMGYELNNVPCFILNNHMIWGATAMILNEFKNVVSQMKTN